mgnify:FL=1
MAKRFKPATCATVADVLMRWSDMVREEDRAGRTAWAALVNEKLDELLSNDAFGTEGQLDPRGDHRD